VPDAISMNAQNETRPHADRYLDKAVLISPIQQ
jgi:hypothetical protein